MGLKGESTVKNPFKREARPIILKDIKIPVGKGYTMNGTIPDVVHELQMNIIIIEQDRKRLRNALNAKQQEIYKLKDEISSLNRKLFQQKHEQKAR
jgi:prefoldin subunit 5